MFKFCGFGWIKGNGLTALNAQTDRRQKCSMAVQMNGQEWRQAG